jgi:23S rRNA (guanosine2251-2'-O)-methyltransferase
MNMEKDGSQNREFLYGVNPITTLLEVNSGRRRIYKIVISRSRKSDSRIEGIKRIAREKGINISIVPPGDIRDMAPGAEKTQNIMAEVSPYNVSGLDDYLKSGPGSRLVILDRITDVGNFGSIIRNCRAFGFDGIIIAKNRSVSPGSRVSAISAGALEGVRVFRVTNLAQAIKQLKTGGFWIYGTTLEKDRKVQDLEDADFVFPMAIVLGSEDRGMSRLVAENCDFLVSINLTGSMQSLNVSVAGGIILYRIQEKYRKAKN